MVKVSQTALDDSPTLSATIGLPYRLTTGAAAGSFLAELGNRRILGARCPACARVLVPAQDFCAPCRTATDGLVEVASRGAISGFTETAAGILALVTLDGADTPMVHRILDAAFADLALGQPVAAVWADEPAGGMLDLAGFRLVDGAPGGEVGAARPFEGGEEQRIQELPYRLELHYEHAYGPLYGRLFDELATHRRILGVRCPKCESVLVPPRARCDQCYVRTGVWVDVADTGVLRAFSVIHLEFEAQVRPPPYVYAEIVLDGASTKLIHVVGGIDIDEAPRLLRPGMRVRAVWGDGEPDGTLADIEYFEPILDEES